jgi:hypothetical protein
MIFALHRSAACFGESPIPHGGHSETHADALILVGDTRRRSWILPSLVKVAPKVVGANALRGRQAAAGANTLRGCHAAFVYDTIGKDIFARYDSLLLCPFGVCYLRVCVEMVYGSAYVCEYLSPHCIRLWAVRWSCRRSDGHYVCTVDRLHTHTPCLYHIIYNVYSTP